MKTKILVSRFLAITFCFILIQTLIFAANDPFKPKNQVTLWLKRDSLKDHSLIESFITQLGFEPIESSLQGRALITNRETLTECELQEIASFVDSGGKVILFGTENFPEIRFLGKHTNIVPYIEIKDPSLSWQKPTVLEYPKNLTPISIFVISDTDLNYSILASSLKDDGVTPFHVEPLNISIIRTDWGLYSGFDWFQPNLLEDQYFRRIFIYWLRMVIWG